LGSGIGIRENAARIVIDIGGNEARPEHGEEEQYADSPALGHAVYFKCGFVIDLQQSSIGSLSGA
jgi:hypothetical protein